MSDTATLAAVDPDKQKGWIRRLAPVVRPHRRVILGSLAAAIVALAMQTAIPQVLATAVNALGARQPIVPYVWVLLGLGLGVGLIGYIQRVGLQRLSIEIEVDLRRIMFEHMNRLSFQFFDTVQTGQLISRANSDIRAIQMFLSFAPGVITQLLMFVAALTLMLRMHVVLTLAMASTLPLVFMTGLRMRRRLFPISWLMMARQADLATIVEENVTGTRVVKSFGAETGQLQLFERAARRLRWASRLQVNNQAQFTPLMMNLPRLSQALLLLYGGWLVIEQRLSLGHFLAFSSYLVMLQAPFMMLGFVMAMGQRAAAAAQRILEVLDAEPTVVDRPGAYDLEVARGDVEMRDVVFGYRDGAKVLDGFSLRLDAGETVALVGRTGCGKSTVARLIPRFYDVDDGAVLIDGHDVRDITLRSLRDSVGLVLDEPFLFSESVRDNIAFGRPDAPIEDVVAAARAAGADDFIRELSNGYDTVVGERGYTLSGGQRQRIAIARTLLVNPPVLILDDATSSIDAQREHEIHGALRTLMKGRTTLIIAHRLSTISLADRVVLMEGGRIVASGTHAELLAGVPLYAEVLAQDFEHAEGADELDPEGPVHAAPAVPAGSGRPVGAGQPGETEVGVV